MRATKTVTAAGVLTLLSSAPLPAHIGDHGAALPHFLTGEHLLVLVILGVCVAGLGRFSSRKR